MYQHHRCPCYCDDLSKVNTKFGIFHQENIYTTTVKTYILFLCHKVKLSADDTSQHFTFKSKCFLPMKKALIRKSK